MQPVAEVSAKAASAAQGASLDALLSGADGPADDCEDESPGAGGDASSGQREPVASEQTVSVTELPEAANEAAFKLVDTMSTGSWVQFRQSEEHQYRCRLAAVLKAVDKYIFVNRSGKKVAEWSRRELAANLATQAVVLLDDRQLFDRALESLIAQLRSPV